MRTFITQKILIVDDKPENLFATKEILKQPHLEIVTALSGNDALAKVLRDDFALILMDVQMPEMDGFETAALMRGFDRTRHTPIVFISGFTEQHSNLFKGYETGAIDFIFKPIDGIILKSKVNAFLELHYHKQAALENEARLQALIEAMPDLILRVRQGGIIEDINVPSNWENVVQIDGNVIGKSVQSILPTSLARRILEIVRKQPRRGETETLESKLPHPEEGERFYELTIVGSRDDEAVVLVRDITDRKKAAEREIEAKRAAELQTAYMELEAAHEALKKNQAALIQTEKMAALGEMIAGIAHEMKQPLNVIGLISQTHLRDIKRNEIEIEEMATDFEELVRQVSKMKEIIDRMRVYTRRSIDQPHQPLNVNELVDRALGWIRQQMHTHNIKISTQLAQDLPDVMGDPVRLEQAFLNLIINARDALELSQNEGKRIQIDSRVAFRKPHSAEEKNIVVEISDNGMGIPANTIDRIFESFYTTKDKDRGTGLGLYITREIVKEHGGAIEVESQEGQGAVFRIILPCAKLEEESQE